MSIFFSLSGYFVCLSIMFCCLFVCECSVCLWMLFLSCLLWMLFQSCRLWVFFKYFRMWMLFLFVCLWMLFCLSFCEFSSYLSVCTFVSLCVNALSGGECFLFSFCLLVYNCTSCWFVCEFPLFICLWMFFLLRRLWAFFLCVRQWFCLFLFLFAFVFKWQANLWHGIPYETCNIHINLYCYQNRFWGRFKVLFISKIHRSMYMKTFVFFCVNYFIIIFLLYLF